MKTRNYMIVLALASATFASGCSSTISKEDIVEEEIRISEMRADAAEQERERLQGQVEEVIDETPDWVLNPPRADKTGFYGVGSGSSSDPVISARKATLQAKYDLASTVKSELSGEDTMSSSGDEASPHNYRYVINNFVNQVDVSGYELIKREVVPLNGKYQTYALYKLPYEKFNELIKNKLTPRERETIDESYQRLMDRVNSNESDNQ